MLIDEAQAKLTAEERGCSTVITDPHLANNPIVYVSDAFVLRTGYTRREALGRNCRFLQGPDTDPTAVAKIHEGLRLGRAMTVDLLNYRKDGRPFWNRLRIRPVLDESGAVEYFVGVQTLIDPGEVGIRRFDDLRF